MKTNTNSKARTITAISIVLAIVALIVLILVNFMPVLNIKLPDVSGVDYTFNAPGGHNILGWQCIFYWWGPSIYIGGVSACNFNIWLFLGMFLPILALLICTPKLFKALYKKKRNMEFITAALLIFSGVIFLCASPAT